MASPLTYDGSQGSLMQCWHTGACGGALDLGLRWGDEYKDLKYHLPATCGVPV